MTPTPSELRPPCQNCGRPLDPNFDLGGLCQACLLSDTSPETWKPKAPPSYHTIASALPRFEVTSKLGQGGAGAVYEAIDTQTDRVVAIKATAVHPKNPEFETRFWREAKVMANFNHPNIVTVHDVQKTETVLFLVMEHLDGGTLAEKLKSHRRLPFDEALRVIRDIAKGLAYAHEQGVIHRDIKPSNILLDGSGNAKLGDFGLVKGLTQEEFREVALTRTSMAVGTPYYMAPEQRDGSPKVDQRADLYSLGAVFYELLTGNRYEIGTAMPSAEATVPRYIDAVVERALQPKAAERFDSAQDFLTTLDPGQASHPHKSRLLIAATALTLFLIGWVLGKQNQSAQDPSANSPHLEAPTFGTFTEEIDPSQWLTIANYEFENDLSNSSDYEQPTLKAYGGAVVEMGNLRVSGFQDFVRIEQKISWISDQREPSGIGINIRYFAKEYLGDGQHDQTILDFHRRWNLSLSLVRSRWETKGPAVIIGEREGLAPSGTFEPLLRTGQWHDVWIILDKQRYRAWINGAPIYSTPENSDLEKWGEWTFDRATLGVGRFRGLIDHVRIWAKR